jgi:flagellar hook-associated protein 3 FlgL
MSVQAVSTAFFNSQSSADLKRVQAELADLQRQIGSQHKANDLEGYGADSGRILSAQSLISKTDARQSAAANLTNRLDAVDMSLGQASDAAESLREAILNAVGANDGTNLDATLQSVFDSARSALNQSFEGEALFAGDRVGAQPINVTSLASLAAAPSTNAIFDEGARAKTMDLGDGPFAVAEKASDVSFTLFDTMRSLKQLLDASGGTLSAPLTPAQQTALQGYVTSLTTARDTIVTAQGRNGELSKSVDAKATSLSAQSDALQKLVSDTADADLADVATRISMTQVQFQAIAQTYATLSHLSLLDYLPPPA